MKKQLLNKIINIIIKTVKTGSQTAIGMIGVGAVTVQDVNWFYVASASALSMIICLLQNISDLKEIEEEIKEEK